MKLLSVCIPSYNMEKYLNKNIDSFLNSGCLEEIELIIVNDGSKDATLKIAKYYKELYPDTIVIIDKPNGHYGSCINAALKIATGKYFRIVDADDWVDSCALKTLLNAINHSSPDVFYTRYSDYYEIDGTYHLVDDPADMIWDQIVDISNIRFKEYVHMHQLTYSTSFLKNIGFRQTEGICYTDTEYVFIPLVQAKTIYCIKESLYQYYIGRNDQSMSKTNISKNFTHFHKVFQSVKDYIPKSQTNANFSFLRTKYIYTLLNFMVNGLYFTSCKNKNWGSLMRQAIDELKIEGYDYQWLFNINVHGFHWLKWLYKNDICSRLKLEIFFFLVKIKRNN